MSELRRLQDAAQMTPQLHMDFRSLQGIPTPVMTIGMDGYSISEGTVIVRVHQCPADMRIDTDHMEIEIQAKGSKGGRNKSPSLIANIPIIDLQKTAKMP